MTVLQKRGTAIVLRAMITTLLFAVTLSSGPLFAQNELTNQWHMTNSSVSVDMSRARQTMQMVVNTSREITADQVFKRVRIQNPNVLDAIPLEGGNRLQVSALTTGVTQIDLLGANDSVHTIEVMVLGDVRELEAILRQQFPEANLTIVPVQQGCIVSGFVTADEHVETIMQIAELYFPTVINKVTVTGVHTVQLEVQIMEISRTKLRELGIDWAFANGDDFVTQTVGGLINSVGPVFNSTGRDTVQIGVVENGSSFFTAIRALRRNNLVKVLASPTLTAVDGRPASFNSGGEIPIVVPAGLGQVGIQFREFGTRLDYVAKVRGGGRIWLEVRPYVSEIDPSRSVILEGVNVPGLRSRFLETGVELGAGQTLALAGLLQVRTETINTGIPFFADLPWVGTIFRSTREEQNEIELMITVTPNFAGPMNPHEVPHLAPGVSSQSPTDGELYLRGYIETPVTGDFGAFEQSGASAMFETAPYESQITTPTTEFPNSGTQPIPPPAVPNPAAMSVGPNAPKLARQPGLLPPPNSLSEGSAYPAPQNSDSAGSVVR